MEDQFLVLKDDTDDMMQHVERLEKKLSISKTKLLTVNKKNYQLYTEDEMKSVYKETEDIRKQLSIEYEREMNIVNKRNCLENELKTIRQLAEKSDYISSNFDFAYGILSGN